MSDEARKRMLEALPHMRIAAKEAAAEGQVMLGILALKPDGSGRVTVRFEAEGFFEDLAAILGAGPITPDQEMDAKAAKLLHQFGL